MRTILVRNVDAAECALAQNLTAAGLGDQRSMPIPLSVVMTTPRECATFHAPEPAKVLVAAANLIVTCVTRESLNQLREGRGRWAIGPHQLFARQDMFDGTLHVMVATQTWDVAQHDVACFALLHQYLSAEAKCEPGLLTVVIQEAWSSEDLSDITDDPANDRYARDVAHATIPMISLPVGRWRRELELLIQKKGEGEFEDPWLSGVLAPAFRLQELEDGPERSQLMSNIIAQDWRSAILESECPAD